MPSPLSALCQAARSLARTPLLCAMLVLVLALGLGAATALFSVVSTLLLRPLPYPQPERLVRVYELFPLPGGEPGQGSVSLPNLEDWRAGSTSFEHLAAYSLGNRNLQSGGQPERLATAEVSPGTFATLGVAPLHGRGFRAEEDALGAPPVAVLSHGLWQRRFGGDRGVLGTTVTLDGAAHTVVGVMPADFQFPPGGARTELWLPLRVPADLAAARGTHWLAVLGRLAPGRGFDAAQAEMERLAARIAEEHPDTQQDRSVRLVPLAEVVVGRVRPALLVLLAGTGLLLVIACANAANLLLARAAGRRREVAIRTSLGAAPRHLALQLAAEAAVLTAAATAGALVVAWLGVRGLVALAGPTLPRAAEIGVDGVLLAFVATLAALVTGVLALAPARQAASARVHELLKETAGRGGSGGRASRRLRGALVAGQVALSLVLLVGAGLLLETFLGLLDTETGLDPRGVVTLRVSLPEPGDSGPLAADRLLEPVRERVAALPGVTGAGWISHLPLRTWGTNGNFAIEGRPQPERPADAPFAEYRLVGPGYFAALGIPVLAGRDLTAGDRDPERPVALVNRALAERYFPDGGAVGQRLVLGDVPSTIVGVVGDVRQAELAREPLPELYVPYFYRDWQEMSLVIDAAVPPASVAADVRRAIQRVDPAQAVYDLETMEEVIAGSLIDRRLYLLLLAAFAVLATVLSVAGIHGVVSHAVAEREREMAIRLALGARPGGMVGLVVRDGARLALAGLAVGVPAALLLTRLLEGLLHGVAPGDPATLAAAALLLLAVTVLATWLPARRAARIDPATALAAE